MRRIIVTTGLVFALALVAAPASAAAIIIFNSCVAGGDCALVGHGFIIKAATPGSALFSVLTPDVANPPGGPVDVFFTGPLQQGVTGLGFNLAGDPVAITNLTPGFTISNNQSVGPFGTFEYIITPPPGVISGVSFRLTRPGGYFDFADIFEPNADGYIAGANVRGFNVTPEALALRATIGATGDNIRVIVTPEPASMVLLGLGLMVAMVTRALH